jgi:hypothetical protein
MLEQATVTALPDKATPDPRQLFSMETFRAAAKADVGNEACACLCACACL